MSFIEMNCLMVGQSRESVAYETCCDIGFNGSFFCRSTPYATVEQLLRSNCTIDLGDQWLTSGACAQSYEL